MIPVIDYNSVNVPLTEYINNNKRNILQKTLFYGCLLFRNFDASSAGFEKAIDAFDMYNMDMLGSAAPRTKISKSVYTANDSPASQIIPMHHEMAQTTNPPSHIFFYCDQPSKKGGETPLMDSRIICDFLKDNYFEEMMKLHNGIYYTRRLPFVDDKTSAIGNSWKKSFDVSSVIELEHYLIKNNMMYEWHENGDISVKTPLMPVFNSVHGRTTFFNSLIAAYNGWNDCRNVGRECVLYYDNTTLNPDFMAKLNEFVHEKKMVFKWKKKDVLMVDNRVMMHSRNTFVPPRRILTSIKTQFIPRML
jgi:hypothetical protein